MTVETILKEKGGGIISVEESARIAEVVALLKAHRIGAVLVVRADGGIAGVLSERDIVRRLADDGAGLMEKQAADLMTREVVTCRPTDTIAGVMAAMTEGRFRHLPVLDATGGLVGMISIGDVVKQRIAETELEAQALKEYIATG